MPDAISQTQLSKWWNQGTEMLLAVDAELAELALRTSALKVTRRAMLKLFGKKKRSYNRKAD